MKNSHKVIVYKGIKMTKIDVTKVQLRKRIKGRENYYVSMPVGSEIHIVNEKNIIVKTLKMESNGLRVWE